MPRKMRDAISGAHQRDALATLAGDMAQRIREHDWTKSPLGPIAQWSPALINTVLLMLPAQAEIVMFWGQEFVALYNDAYAPTIGEKHPRALGRPARENWSELWDDLEPLLRGVRETGKTFVAKDRAFYIERRGFGETVYFDVSYSAVREADGAIAGVLCIVNETTARVLAEQKTRADRDRFSEMFRQAPSFMAQLDGPDHVFAFTNDTYQQLIGHRDVIGKNIREALPDIAGQGFYELLDQVYRSGKPFLGRSVAANLQRSKDSPLEQRVLDFVYQPIKAAGGQTTGIFVEGTDVTEQRAAESALRESEERLRMATDNANIALWDVDAGGRVAMTYASGNRSFTMPQDRRTPIETFFAQLHPDDAAQMRAAYDAARDPEQREAVDVEYRVPATETMPARWMKLRGRAVFDASDRFERMSGTVIEITRERDTQEALRFSTQQLRLATEYAEVGLWDVNNVDNTLFWSPEVRDAFGVSHDVQVTMEDFYNGLHPDDRAMTAAAYDAANDPDKRALYDVEYRTLGKNDAKIRWVHAKGRGIFDTSGKCLRVVGTAIDITRNREIAQAFQRSEEQLRLATEYSGIGLWDIDTVNDIVYWPPRVNVMFGFGPGESVTMKQFRAALHPDDKRKTIELILDACDPAKRTFYDAEYRIIRKNDGAVRWVSAKGRAMFDDNGVCMRMLGVIIDITDRKAMEEKARESEMRFRTLFESIDDGFCIVEAIRARDGTIHDFRYIEENPALAKRSGIVGVLGRTIREMLPIEADGWIEIIGKVQTSGEPIRFERFLETTQRLLELYVLRVEPASRDQVAVLFQDITDRRASELRLHEMNETLEKRVLERTAALEKSQAALQQAQKMEAIGNLTGGIAHDFNNLLQGLSGNLDLIRRKPDDAARVQRWAESGLQAAERGAKLTAQLLAFSRSQKLELRALDLSKLLPGMRELLSRTLGPSVEIAVDLEAGAQTVLGDETQLEMAVLNLAINARDAMPDGGKLSIATKTRALENAADLAPGDYVELTVTDTGAGMAPDVIARAFDPFFTTKGVGKGTGLGLSQVYGMIHQAGGTARIQSVPGKGTTVSLFLRKTSQSAISETRVDDAQVNGKAHAAKILVIDDDPGVRQFLTDSLSAFGYDVSEAENGPIGLSLIESFAPDLTVIDFAMPGMTGAEVAKKARGRRPDLPVIFASGYADTAAIESQRDEHTAVLRKPFRIGELQDAITRLLVR